MDYYQIVRKLIGEIEPVGETNTDEKRLENLKNMTALISKLLTDVDYVACNNLNSSEYSRIMAGKFASDFFDSLGIKND